MSQRTPGQGYASSYEPARQTTANPTHDRFPSSTNPPSTEQRGFQLLPPPSSSSRAFELPPLSRRPVERTSPILPRSATLPSVLNPVPEDARQSSKAYDLSPRRHHEATLPPMRDSSLDQNAASPFGSTFPSYPNEPLSHFGRRVLTPKSPLRRAMSLTQMHRPGGSMSAQQNLFPLSPSSGPYRFETGSLPGLTPPEQLRRGGYGFPSMGSLPTDPPRRPSPEMRIFSKSPSPTYSGYEDNSPSAYSTYEQAGSSYLSVVDSAGAMSRGISVPASATSGGQSVTAASGQGAYQMMTFKTSEGDVRIPVDVQAASRVQDEKRKRNAGASARFRERRKKKELEAATTISKLEQRIKDITEDAEFYKKERDILAGITRGISGGEHQLAARPPSPRTRRQVGNLSSSSQPGASSSSAATSPILDRRVRRRTSSFPMAQAPESIPQPLGGQSEQQTQPPQNYDQTQTRETYHHHRTSSATGMLPPASHMAAFAGGSHSSESIPPPSIMQVQPRPGPYNPFATRYDLGR